MFNTADRKHLPCQQIPEKDVQGYYLIDNM